MSKITKPQKSKTPPISFLGTVVKTKNGKSERKSKNGETSLGAVKLNNQKFRKTQACDRCRLKKIKCDGVKPSCSNCLKSSFICNTSHKLARRGLPKGYTEALEHEVVRLKTILDENKIKFMDMDENMGLKENEKYMKKNTQENTIRNYSHKNEAVTDGEEKNEKCSEETVMSNSNSNKMRSNISSKKIKTQWEKNLPEMNNTFYLYQNYSYAEWNPLYMGTNTWVNIKNKYDSNFNLYQKENDKNENTFDKALIKEIEFAKDKQIESLIETFDLNSNVFYLPQFLIQKYENNEPNLKKLLFSALNNFFETQNSLVPLLYPFAEWKSLLIELISDNSFKKPMGKYPDDLDPVILLCFLFIIEINWSCLDHLKLFQLTKHITLSSTNNNIQSFQVLLLGSYFFMGHGQNDQERNIWSSTASTELINFAYTKVLNLGLYINSNNIKTFVQNDSLKNKNSLSKSKKCSVNLVSFWCFQFLHCWWSFIQGLPKVNFLVEVFQPRNIRKLEIPQLTPFAILIDFVTGQLEGGNLLHCLSSGEKSKVILENELFRNNLAEWKLYHSLKDHDILQKFFLMIEDSENNSKPRNKNNKSKPFGIPQITLEKSEIVEIQLTLYYLIIALISNIPQTDIEGTKKLIDSEEICYEILSLYYLLMIDSKNNEQPKQYKVSHLLPCSNEDLINLCLGKLIHFTECSFQNKQQKSTRKDKSEKVNNWRYKRNKYFLIQWCQIWFYKNFDDPLFEKIKYVFNFSEEESNFFDNSEVDKQNNLISIKDYNNSLEKFHSFGNNNILLRTDSKAVMDQFNIFATGLNSNFSTIFQDFTLPKHSDTNNKKENENSNSFIENHHASRGLLNLINNKNRVNEEEIISQFGINSSNTNKFRENQMLYKSSQNNLLNSTNKMSPFLSKLDETDDGYAEDDDEEDEENAEENMKPLEIPFKTKRKNSLFHQRHIQPPSNEALIYSSIDSNFNNDTFKNDNRTTNEGNFEEREKTIPPDRNPDYILHYNSNINTHNGNDLNNVKLLQSSKHLEQDPRKSNTMMSTLLPMLNANSNIRSPEKDNGSSMSPRLAPPQQLLLPNIVPTNDPLNSAIIKSPFASTLFLQSDILHSKINTTNNTTNNINNSDQNKNNNAGPDFSGTRTRIKSRESLLNQQALNSPQHEGSAKTPPSFIDMLLSHPSKTNINMDLG